MKEEMRDRIVAESVSRIEAAITYEQQVCEYKRGVAELVLRAPYLEILSNPAKYYVPGAKVKVDTGGYALHGDPSPAGIGSILEVGDIQYPKAIVRGYLVRFDDPDRWSGVNFPYDWKRFEEEWGNGRYEARIEELKTKYEVWERCRRDVFVKCLQQWVPANYCNFVALAPGMEWPDHIIQ